MPLNIIKRPQADRDLEECFVYIAEDNLDIGVRFLVAVETTLEELSQFPMIGKARSSIAAGVDVIRIWPVRGFGRYLLCYVVRDDAVELVRVLYSSRDLDVLLDR